MLERERGTGIERQLTEEEETKKDSSVVEPKTLHKNNILSSCQVGARGQNTEPVKSHTSVIDNTTASLLVATDTYNRPSRKQDHTSSIRHTPPM